MPSITIADPYSAAQAVILPELGFNCYSFTVKVHGRAVEVLDAVPGFERGDQRPTASGIPILFPFPNRIREGKFTWDGKTYQLPRTDKFGNAIHGFCHDRPWRVIRQGADFVTGRFQLSVDAPDRAELWPADFVIEVDYELRHSRLRANFRILNPSTVPLPWGLGTHAYFKAPLIAESNRSNCTIEAPVTKYWELIDCLPTGELKTPDEELDLGDGPYLEGLKLDHVFTGVLCDGPQFDCVVTDEKAGLQVTQTCPAIFREVVAFTPPNRDCVCLEPYTCVTDAVNLSQRGVDAGWRTLKSGGEFKTWIDITAGPILA